MSTRDAFFRLLCSLTCKPKYDSIASGLAATGVDTPYPLEAPELVGLVELVELVGLVEPVELVGLVELVELVGLVELIACWPPYQNKI